MEALKSNTTNEAKVSWWEEFELRYQHEPAVVRRIDSLDLARGIAIILMVLSHTVKGLLTFEQMPSWGIMPIHTITKFSSSTFFLIFGVTLAIFTGPVANTPGWSKRRNRLLRRGFLILVWYKLLTVVQMFQTYSVDEIVNTLLYRSFPDFVEVLGFYGIFLLWFPFVLPAWARLKSTAKVVVILTMAVSGHLLSAHFDFWDMSSLKTILVEYDGRYTFGQFQRGALVLAGWMLGDVYLNLKPDSKQNTMFASILFTLSLICFAYFLGRANGQMADFLAAISRNYGKHPPSLVFAAFSVGGALAITAFCFWMHAWRTKLWEPIKVIGRWPLFSFCFHILIVFIFYRYLFGLHRNTTYGVAWALVVALVFITSSLAWIYENRKK